jgi:hypothetical protein
MLIALSLSDCVFNKLHTSKHSVIARDRCAKFNVSQTTAVIARTILQHIFTQIYDFVSPKTISTMTGEIYAN